MKSKPSPKSNPYYLYLDTSEPVATIAIFEGDRIVKEEKWEAGRELSKTLSKKYEEILSSRPEQDSQSESIEKFEQFQRSLSGFCVFVGPGSFTGLRIGISFINGLAFALGVPVYETKVKGQLNLNEPKEMARPFYGSEPHITQPKQK